MNDQRRLKNVKKLSRFFVGMENFTFREGKIVAFFFPYVVYYFGDLLKSATKAHVQNKKSSKFMCVTASFFYLDRG